MEYVSAVFAAQCLPTLAVDTNKYPRGLCELVVGSRRYPGAGVLACLAANRMGAGYVRAFTCKETAQALLTLLPSAVCCSVEDFDFHTHESRAGHPRAVVVGCGMEGSEAEVALVLDALANTQAPVLVDGGGLQALCHPRAESALATRQVQGLPTVITPHAGEAFRLMHALDQQAAQHFKSGSMEPVQAARFLASHLGVTCALKGPNTFIAHQDACLTVTEGTPALAKAGTGDILAGLIGSLLAQGVGPTEAAAAGCFIHARAGCLAARDLGERCVAAEDVLAYVAPAVRSLC